MPILFVKMSMPRIEAKSHISIFIDVTDKSEVVKSLIDKIKIIRFIENVKLIIEPILKGITIDNTYSILTMMNDRVAIFRKNAYEAFIKALREKMGSAYEALLYHIGYEIGRGAYKSHEKLIKNIQEASS